MHPASGIRYRLLASATALLAFTSVLTLNQSAQATFPGLDGVVAGVWNGQMVLVDPNDGSRATWFLGGQTFAWSPSGDRLAVPDGNGLWTVNPDGTGKSFVQVGEGAENAAWSPDGARIAYNSPEGIVIIDVDGSNRTVVPNTDWFSLSDWSPDGEWLLGSKRSEEDPDEDLWKIRADGSDLAQIVDRPGHQLRPTWSPDGTQIAFEDWISASDHEISLVSPNGGSVITLTQSSGLAQSPSWSPSGSRIVFARTYDGSQPRLFTIAIDGSDLRQIPNRPYPITSPEWQPAQVILDSSRDMVKAGERFTLSVRIPGGGQTNRSVVIQRRTTGDWIDWRQVDVDITGSASTSARISEHTRFRARWGGDEVHIGGRSLPVLVKARVVVSGRLTRYYARSGQWHLYRPGRRVWYTATIRPTLAGKKLCFLIQALRNQRWRSIVRRCWRMDSTGKMAIYLYDLPSGLAGRIRAEYKGDPTHAPNRASWSYFKVR